MSSRHRCNRCMLNDLERFARSSQQAAHMMPNVMYGGFDVVVLPVGVPPEQRYDDKPAGWAAWLWDVSEGCVC